VTSNPGQLQGYGSALQWDIQGPDDGLSTIGGSQYGGTVTTRQSFQRCSSLEPNLVEVNDDASSGFEL
jgi:hypothetical protein